MAASFTIELLGDSAVLDIPDTVSYGALLLVINERLKQRRTLDEQRYFVELANQLLSLYWRQIEEVNSRRAA